MIKQLKIRGDENHAALEDKRFSFNLNWPNKISSALTLPNAYS